MYSYASMWGHRIYTMYIDRYLAMIKVISYDDEKLTLSRALVGLRDFINVADMKG